MSTGSETPADPLFASFRDEIAAQSRAGVTAWNSSLLGIKRLFEQGGKGDAIEGILQSVQSMLVSAAIISNILWPQQYKMEDATYRSVESAAKRLRAELQVGATSTLANRDIRNDLLHPERSIAEWVQSNPHSYRVPIAILQSGQRAARGPETFRLMVLGERDISIRVGGAPMPLMPLAEELSRLTYKTATAYKVIQLGGSRIYVGGARRSATMKLKEFLKRFRPRTTVKLRKPKGGPRGPK